MRPQRIACALALLCGTFSLTVPAQPAARDAGAAASAPASKDAFADARRRAQDTPFAFRGIALGITLDEFRAGSKVRATPVGSVPVCETDVQAGALGMRLKSHESLTVACRWAHRDDNGWALSQAVVDGAPAAEHVLRFARMEGQSALRLYEISFVIDEVTAEDLRATRSRTATARRVMRRGTCRRRARCRSTCGKTRSVRSRCVSCRARATARSLIC